MQNQMHSTNSRMDQMDTSAHADNFRQRQPSRPPDPIRKCRSPLEHWCGPASSSPAQEPTSSTHIEKNDTVPGLGEAVREGNVQPRGFRWRALDMSNRTWLDAEGPVLARIQVNYAVPQAQRLA